MSVENPRHFVYEYDIYIKYIIFFYKYALILTLTLTLTLNPNLSVKYSRHFVYEYDIFLYCIGCASRAHELVLLPQLYLHFARARDARVPKQAGRTYG